MSTTTLAIPGGLIGTPLEGFGSRDGWRALAPYHPKVDWNRFALFHSLSELDLLVKRVRQLQANVTATTAMQRAGPGQQLPNAAGGGGGNPLPRQALVAGDEGPAAVPLHQRGGRGADAAPLCGPGDDRLRVPAPAVLERRRPVAPWPGLPCVSSLVVCPMTDGRPMILIQVGNVQGGVSHQFFFPFSSHLLGQKKSIGFGLAS